MNIILVTRFYPPDTGGGGIAAYTKYAAQGLTQAGHHVRVISAMARGSQVRQTVDGIEVVRVQPPLGSYYWTRLPLMGRQMRLIRDIFFAWRVRQILIELSREQPPDLVEYADIDAESLFHPHQLCPNVVKLHTPHAVLRPYYSDREVPYARRGIEWLEAKTIHKATGISSPSQYLAHEIEKTVGVQPGRIQYVPNFIDTDFWSPAQNHQVEQESSVLYVGRLEERKGALFFANAIPAIASVVPQAKFLFLGTDRFAKDGGSQKTALLRSFENQGLQDRIEFHDHASPEVFRSFYRRAAVFVLPSLFENSPYTLLEAAACAKPCVVHQAGGMPEMIVDGESGLLFNPGDAADLARKVIQLLQSPGQRVQLGLAARRRVEQEYSLSVGTQKTLAFYQSVMGS